MKTLFDEEQYLNEEGEALDKIIRIIVVNEFMPIFLQCLEDGFSGHEVRAIIHDCIHASCSKAMLAWRQANMEEEDVNSKTRDTSPA